jgi:tripartite-type tricarboxylate transporter receptor subunit TctC
MRKLTEIQRCLGVVLPLLALAGPPARSQSFPDRTITLVVPFPAGGSTDVAARAIAEPMAAALGKNVIVENVGGGSGLIGTGRVARAAPDGYTLLVHQMAIAANASLFPKSPFNVEKDFVGVGLVNYSAPILLGRKSLAADSVADLVGWLKQPGQRARVAHAGIGTNTHFCAILFARAVEADIELIPYRGGAPAISDVIAGHVDLYCSNAAGEQIKAGTVKAFGVASKERLANYPDLPSLVQLGLAGTDILFWQGMFAPAGTPRTIVEKLNAALREALADPKVVKSFEQQDFSVFPESEQSIAAANSLLHAEIGHWSQVVRDNKIDALQ